MCAWQTAIASSFRLLPSKKVSGGRQKIKVPGFEKARDPTRTSKSVRLLADWLILPFYPFFKNLILSWDQDDPGWVCGVVRGPDERSTIGSLRGLWPLWVAQRVFFLSSNFELGACTCQCTFFSEMHFLRIIYVHY